ncbi:MAG TPA: hypothetical protein VMB72_07325 [Acidimicrobiales bacterium]|nr:hypothetical protein [Acidimicrobiales bacterium]
MTTTAFCSGKGAPGVTTLVSATGAVWPASRRVIVAECDPSGNDLAVRFGLSPSLGMTSLVVASRRERSAAPVEDHLQELPGGLAALVGPVHATAARRLDAELARLGAGILPEEHDVLLDCGRLDDGCRGQETLLASADQVVVVVRPDAAGIAHGRAAVGSLRSSAPGGVCAVVTVGTSAYRVEELEDALEVAVLAEIPLDHTAAAIVAGVPGKATRLARSRLVASARVVARHLAAGSVPAARPGRAEGPPGRRDPAAGHDGLPVSSNGHGAWT